MTLSRVTRRAAQVSSSRVDCRVTIDRAVWTKPLASAGGRGSSAASFQSYGRARRRWWPADQACVRRTVEGNPGELNDVSNAFGQDVRDVEDAETRQRSAGPS